MSGISPVGNTGQHPLSSLLLKENRHPRLQSSSGNESVFVYDYAQTKLLSSL